jgi:8-O-methyltransferase
LGIAAGARRAKVLSAAVEVGVFGVLADGSVTAAELASRTNVHPQWAPHLLYALEGLGLVERTDKRYRNSAAADRYLVPGRPAYLGGFLSFLDTALHPAWDGLAGSLRTGEPRAGLPDPYADLYADPADRDGFLDAMDVLNAPIAAALAELDWSAHASVVDVGGARGNVAAHLAKAHSHLSVGVFDLPALREAFDAHVAALGLADRVTFTGGDFFADPLPAADALLFGHVLHNWPVSRRRALLRAAYAALSPGGVVYVYDPVIDPDRPALPNVLASLNMLVWSAGGSEYTAAEATGWLREAGFEPLPPKQLTPTITLLAGRKADAP